MDDDTDYFESSTTERVVVHLECNDFYASVERKLHGIGESVPIALVQDKTWVSKFITIFAICSIVTRDGVVLV